MNCACICYFSLCIGTALAVLYNGEAPKQKSETVVGALQQQQRLDSLTLPGYHYSEPATTAQQAFTGYRYSAPAATAVETTTSTTTVGPPTTAAPTQPAAIGYIYNKPLAESYNRQPLYLHTPHYQLSHQTSALALSGDADVGQQLLLAAAPTYYVPQAEVINSGKHFEATQPNFFVPRIVTGAAEVTQTSTPAPQAAKAQGDEAAALTGGYNYARPLSDAELTADTPASYQQAFQQFADYLIWQRAQSKQQEQTRIDTQKEAKQQHQTIPHAAQAYDDSSLQQLSFPSAHRQYEPATAPSSGPIQTRPQAAPVTFATQVYAPATAASTITAGAQQSTNLLASAPASKPASVEKRPLNNGELLSGERFISSDNTVDYYMEMPSQSFELPTYSTMEMTPNQEVGFKHDQSTSQSYAQNIAAKLAQLSSEQLYQNNVEQANAPYFYEPAKQFAQQQRHTPAQQAYVVQEQRPVAAAQQKGLLAKAQQQSEQLASDKRFAQIFAQQSTEATKAQAPQPNAAWFAEIPQWPQNEALQLQQQQQPLQQQLIQQPQTLYSRVAKPLAQAAHELRKPIPQQEYAQLQQQQQFQQQHQLQQQQQSEKQNFYSKAQPEPRPQLQVEPLTTAAADPAGTLAQSFQRLPPPTQAAQPSQATTATANSNAFFNFNSAHFRRPHNTYGVPLENNKASGYNYQRPAGH